MKTIRVMNRLNLDFFVVGPVPELTPEILAGISRRCRERGWHNSAPVLMSVFLDDGDGKSEVAERNV